jgi:hypothetical protein
VTKLEKRTLEHAQPVSQFDRAPTQNQQPRVIDHHAPANQRQLMKESMAEKPTMSSVQHVTEFDTHAAPGQRVNFGLRSPTQASTNP